jgi:hypothetical protein
MDRRARVCGDAFTDRSHRSHRPSPIANPSSPARAPRRFFGFVRAEPTRLEPNAHPNCVYEHA